MPRRCAMAVVLGSFLVASTTIAEDSAKLIRGKDFITPVRDGKAGGYEAFPDIARLADGRIIIAFYAGYQHVSLPNEVWPKGGRISYVTSSDEGNTWSDAQTLYDSAEDDRDSSLAVLKDGRIVCSFFKYPSGDIYNVYSADAGKNWSDPQLIHTSFAVSSPVRVLSSGRLILPCYRSVAISDDNGKSWRFNEIPSATAESAKTGLTETDVIELNSGTILAVHRADGPPMHYTTSTDGGETWGSTLPLKFPGHSPYLFRANPNTIVLAYRGVRGNEEFYDTRLCVSRDEGKTWGEPVIVDNLIGAYPSIVGLRDGSFLITYYEEGAGTDIRVRKFTLADDRVQWLTFSGQQ